MKNKQGQKKEASWNLSTRHFGPARRNARCPGEDKRRGYKPLLPVLAKINAKFGQSFKTNRNVAKARAKVGKECGRDAWKEGWRWKGVGQELGKSSAELDRYLARHPGQAQGGGPLRAFRRAFGG